MVQSSEEEKTGREKPNTLCTHIAFYFIRHKLLQTSVSEHLGKCLNKRATRDAIHIPQIKAVQRKFKIFFRPIEMPRETTHSKMKI